MSREKPVTLAAYQRRLTTLDLERIRARQSLADSYKTLLIVSLFHLILGVLIGASFTYAINLY